jgi:hypothetical protein
MDLEELLRKVDTVSSGTAELDCTFATVFPSGPRKVTRSIDAAVRLIEITLLGCPLCAISRHQLGVERVPYFVA